MMDMQEIKERKPHRGKEEKQDGDIQEADPDVPSVTPLLDENMGLRAKKSTTESWFKYVMDRLWPMVFFTVALLGLHEAQFVEEMLYSPIANRLFVNLGIFASTLVVLFGSYIEIYRSMLLGEKVTYDKAKTSTHGMLASIIAAGICLSIGLWPIWNWLTLAYLFMWFWGVIVQFVVIFPVQVQRVVFAVVYVWFMHKYLSLFIV